jgi:hypothetical protein
LVNENCQTSHPDIYAAGDVATQLRADGHYRRVETWENANLQAGIFARHVMGVEHPKPNPAWFWTGSYARDVRVIVYDGKMHPVDSNELSFMLAARHAFSDAFKQAGPKILEPIYDLEVYVPADFMGDVMSDLQGRRALIMGMDSEAGYQKLSAKIPLKELASYSISLSSLTGGRASFTTKFASYELVPSDIQSKLIADHEAELEKDAE